MGFVLKYPSNGGRKKIKWNNTGVMKMRVVFLCVSVCVFEREREERNRSGQAEVEREILMMFKVLILLGHYMPLLQDISVT